MRGIASPSGVQVRVIDGQERAPVCRPTTTAKLAYVQHNEQSAARFGRALCDTISGLASLETTGTILVAAGTQTIGLTHEGCFAIDPAYGMWAHTTTGPLMTMYPVGKQDWRDYPYEAPELPFLYEMLNGTCAHGTCQLDTGRDARLGVHALAQWLVRFATDKLCASRCRTPTGNVQDHKTCGRHRFLHAHEQYTEARRADFERNALLRPYVRVVFDKMLAPLHSQRLLPSEIITELKADGLWVE